MKRFFVFLFLLVSSCSSLFAQNRGFKHPGGLHTQADFDRIKQQLADGNPTVTAAYQVLKTAAYAQSGAATYPVASIVRGGGSGENYINAVGMVLLLGLMAVVMFNDITKLIIQ